MKIEMISGCTLDSLTVDGVEVRELNDVEAKQVMYKIVSAIPAKELCSILPNLLELFGEYEYKGKCDCCCDDIDKYTWEI